MRIQRPLFVSLSLLSLCAACEERPRPRSNANPDASAPQPRPNANPDASADASADADDEPEEPEVPSDAAVRARPVVRAATAGDPWRTVGTLAALGTREALAAHVRAAAQRRAEAIARAAAERQRQLAQQLSQNAERSTNAASPRTGATRRAGSAAAAESASRARPAPTTPTPTARSNSITNNQVANVDEGDIVKASGDDLIILRRGHLFRVSTANNTLRRVGHAPAFAPGTQPGDWYDELLVDGDIALVLGYSYQAEATEVNRFRLERGGAIRYLDTFYLRSDDYYSSENYATRLVNGRFVMYVPMNLTDADASGRELRLPAVRLGRAGGFRTMLDFTSVFATSGERASSTLHAVLQCDVHAARVECSAHGVMGASSRTFYVSNSAVYVWTTEDEYGPRAAGERAPRSWIVRMPHAAGAQAGAAQIHGGPVDQFAFDERDGALHLLLRDDSRGDGMWSGRRAGGGISALRIPLARLEGTVSDAPAEAYTMLVSASPYGEFKERWVGEWAIFATSSYGGRGHFRMRAPIDEQPPRLFAYRSTDQRLFELRTEQRVERIEPLGQHALVAGPGASGLSLTPIALDGASPEPYAALRLPGVSQGETRSHGFFFNPSGPREGVFGIATTAPSADGEGPGSSDVSFFRVEQLALHSIGTVAARPRRDSRCSTSCYDWYGNTRPIFWGDRVFALMGDEVVEAQLAQRALTERRRIDYGLGVRGVVEED
jgi:hypothetical protein